MSFDPEVRAVSAPWYGGVEILIRHGDAVATDLRFEKIERGRAVPPTLRVTTEAAQTLMDDLWNSGIRPTEGSGSAGSLRATEKHLSDMRKLAFHTLGITQEQ